MVVFQENHVRQDDVVVWQHNCLVLSFVLVLATANVVINGPKNFMDDDESNVEEEPCYENNN